MIKTKTNKSDFNNLSNNIPLNFALVGNPNVGKSTLFNVLTGDTQHTGNWAGKTVQTVKRKCRRKYKYISITDLPGTYSLNSNSADEQVTNNFLLQSEYDCIIVVINPMFLERNLLLTLQTLMITQKVVVCINMSDEAEKNGIYLDADELSLQLGVPVIKISALKKKGISDLLETAKLVANGNITTFELKALSDISSLCYDYESETLRLSEMCKRITSYSLKSDNKAIYTIKDRKLDRVFTSRLTGIPIMMLIFLFVFWLTAVGANYPSDMLSTMFNNLKSPIVNGLTILNVHETIIKILVDGIYTTVSWVVSVMLPPALIFFPLFAILEDSGYLPRIAFNLDRLFRKSGANGKLAITMLMGFGCNTCSVMGCRIINSKRERIVSAVTNSFIPCNGRLPTLIALISIFLTGNLAGFKKSILTATIILILIILAFIMTLFTSRIMTKTILKCEPSVFMMELPSYRKPAILQIIKKSIKEKVIYVLSRAVLVSIPAGIIIWLLGNTTINGITLIRCMADFINPLGLIIGLDGVILTAFILGFPANEIVIPIMLMAYSNGSTLVSFSSLSDLSIILSQNGWTSITAICACIFCLFHFPCSTTCFAIKKETNSIIWVILSILITLTIGITLCFVTFGTAKLGVNLYHIFF